MDAIIRVGGAVGYGKEHHWRLSIINHLAPDLPIEERAQLVKSSKDEFDKWVESKGGYVARYGKKDNHKLRGASFSLGIDYYMGLDLAQGEDYTRISTIKIKHK